MAKKLISEWMVVEAARRGENVISFDESAIVTAAARDRARALGVRLESGIRNSPSQMASPGSSSEPPKKLDLTVAIGSDHGGYQLKEQLKKHLESIGYRVVDLGTYSEEACDYPDYAYAVARMVSLGEASRGIMVDAVGIASAIVANKVPGIRAACCHDEFSARSSREHNDTNVLTLGGRVLGVELAKSIAIVWLETWFGGGRHQKRVDKISEIERRNFKQ